MDSNSQYQQPAYQYTYPNPPYQPHLANPIPPPSWQHYAPQNTHPHPADYSRMYSGVHNPPANGYAVQYTSSYVHQPQAAHTSYPPYQPAPLETSPPQSTTGPQIPSSTGPDRGSSRRQNRQAQSAPYPRADRDAPPAQNVRSESSDPHFAPRPPSQDSAAGYPPSYQYPQQVPPMSIRQYTPRKATPMLAQPIQQPTLTNHSGHSRSTSDSANSASASTPVSASAASNLSLNHRSTSPALSTTSHTTVSSGGGSAAILETQPRPRGGKHSEVPRGTTKSRKQRLYSSDRKEICVMARDNPHMRQEDIAARFGVERSTISKILKNKERWLRATDEVCKVAKFKDPKFPELHNQLDRWLADWPKDKPIHDEDIKQAAIRTAKFLGIPEHKFKASDGWVEGYKRRNGIKMQQWRDGEGMVYVMNRAQGRLNESQTLAEEEAEAFSGPPQPTAVDLAYARGDPITISEDAHAFMLGTPILSPDMRIRRHVLDPMPYCYGADPDPGPSGTGRPEPFVVDEFDDSDEEHAQTSETPSAAARRRLQRDPKTGILAEPSTVPWLLPIPRLLSQPSLENSPRAPDGRRIYKRTKKDALIPIEMTNFVDAEVAEELMFHVVRFCELQGAAFLPELRLDDLRDIWDALRELKKGKRMPIPQEERQKNEEEWLQKHREERLRERGLLPPS